MNESIRKVLNQYDVGESESIQQIDKHNSWMIDDRFILKSFSTDKGKAEKVAQLNALLHQENAPVAKLHLTRTAGLCASVDGNYYTLVDKLPGTTEYAIYDGDSQKRLYTMGRTMAKLHLAMQKIDGKVELWDNNIMDELHGWILKEVRDKKIPVKPEVIQYCTDFAGLYHSLPRQIIHRNPHGGNMCLENDEITGIFYFDMCQINSRIFDMCYAFSPYGCKYDFDKWQAHRPYFFSGYHEISGISKDELAGYTYMTVLTELLFVAFYSTRNQEDVMMKTLESLHWIYDMRDEIVVCEKHLQRG